MQRRSCLSFGGLISDYEEVVTRTGREAIQRNATVFWTYGIILLLPFSHLIPLPQAFPGETFGCVSAVRAPWLSGKSLNVLR